MSQYYSMLDTTNWYVSSIDVFVLANSPDDRALEMANRLASNQTKINYILVIQYQNIANNMISKLFPDSEINVITANNNQVDFLNQLRCLQSKFSVDSRLVVDVSCIHTPEMFTLLKFFRSSCSKERVQVAYSVPFDYDFPEEPFVSYHSYYGDLITKDLLGYGGLSDGKAHSQMIVFLGFEGVLSAKVIEDIQYDDLVLVNNLPSFFPKYKDISVINNYDIITSHHSKLRYVPANNPFETYNFLNVVLDRSDRECVAPLSTKPVALGVCLYALNHDLLRVVYPMSDEYNQHSTNKVYKTYFYDIPLFCA